MATRTKLTAYFSHSWKPQHLPINLALWKRCSKHCNLLVDQPVHEMGSDSPPYYISRIESLIRRSDVFIACIPPADSCPDETIDGDWRLRCSPYILFEMRLAERANLPRFILYDRATCLGKPESPPRHTRYVPCRMSEVIAYLEGDAESDAVLDDFDEWLGWINRNLYPIKETEGLRWSYLLNSDQAAEEAILRTVKAAGFGKPKSLLDGSFANDADLIHFVRSLSLLVVDLSAQHAAPLHHMAHSMMVPTIRLHSRVDEKSDRHLPLLLQGHPAGYQQDTLPVETSDENLIEIGRRADALVRSGSPIVSTVDGRYEFQQRSYKRQLVFLSHNKKGGERGLVNAICDEFESRGIDFWEYERKNQAGQNWRTELDEALNTMTHFIALLSENYETSPTCGMESDTAVARDEDSIGIRPFLLNDRKHHLQKFESKKIHHQRLPADKSDEDNAKAVAKVILADIQR